MPSSKATQSTGCPPSNNRPLIVSTCVADVRLGATFHAQFERPSWPRPCQSRPSGHPGVGQIGVSMLNDVA